VGSFLLKLCFYKQLLILKGATASLKIVAALSEQNISQASYFENSLFRVKQMTISSKLFSAQEVLHWFRVIHFYIPMQSNQSNCNLIVFLRSDFASIFITPPSWSTARSTNAVAQLVVSIHFRNVCTWASEEGGRGVEAPPWILKLLAKKCCFFNFEG